MQRNQQGLMLINNLIYLLALNYFNGKTLNHLSIINT